MVTIDINRLVKSICHLGSRYRGSVRSSLGNILLQAPESLLGGFKNVIILAHGKPQVVLSDVGIGIGVELRGWNGGHANLVDEEPAKFEIPRTISHMRREGIIDRELDRGHVGQHKVPSLRVGVLGL